MNAGLANLATLKAWLLNATMRTGTDYDDDIAAIGLGVAAQLEKHCHRKFARTVGDTYIATGPRGTLVVPRYPLEAVASIETRTNSADAWEEETGAIQHWNADSGLVTFVGALVHTDLVQVRVTYTGGYFYEQLEPADVGYPTAQPAGSTALDADLLLAWQLQCEHVWAQRDKLGLNIGQQPSENTSGALAKIQLMEVVKEMLRPFIRYNL